MTEALVNPFKTIDMDHKQRLLVRLSATLCGAVGTGIVALGVYEVEPQLFMYGAVAFTIGYCFAEESKTLTEQIADETQKIGSMIDLAISKCYKA
jgi:hypothetical protein